MNWESDLFAQHSVAPRWNAQNNVRDFGTKATVNVSSLPVPGSPDTAGNHLLVFRPSFHSFLHDFWFLARIWFQKLEFRSAKFSPMKEPFCAAVFRYAKAKEVDIKKESSISSTSWFVDQWHEARYFIFRIDQMARNCIVPSFLHSFHTNRKPHLPCFQTTIFFCFEPKSKQLLTWIISSWLVQPPGCDQLTVSAAFPRRTASQQDSKWPPTFR